MSVWIFDQVAQMDVAIGVRQGTGNEDASCGHARNRRPMVPVGLGRSRPRPVGVNRLTELPIVPDRSASREANPAVGQRRTADWYQV